MKGFVYSQTTGRVIFGTNTLSSLPQELDRQGLKAAFLLSTPEQVSLAHHVQSLLAERAIGLFTKATMHTPTNVTEEALTEIQSKSADCVVSMGGGSTIGLGKAISIRTKLPHICVPTTYAGSEMTPILGETENGRKVTRRDPAILPGTVLYDVELTKTLPASMTATSGINAIAHAVEALYAANGNPILDMFAVEGIKALAQALPVLVESPQDHDARTTALYGSWLCGICLGNSDMALHHKLCHTLGGTYNLPHAETHTIVLPHALAYNAPEIPDAMRKLATALPDSEGDAVLGLNRLLTKLKVKRALRDFGMREQDIAEAATIAVSNPYRNPATIDRSKIQETIRRAWAGEEAKSVE